MSANSLDLPWRVGDGDEFLIFDKDGYRRIFEAGPARDFDEHDFVDLNGPTDAAFIVRAVNHHEALVEAADKALNVLIGNTISAGHTGDAEAIADAKMALRVVLAAIK